MDPTEDELLVDDVEEYKKIILENVKELETLEVYFEQKNPIHLVHNTKATENIRALLSFFEGIDSSSNREDLIREQIMKKEFIYQNVKYNFMMTSSMDQEYDSAILISLQPVGDHKLGLIIIRDISGLVFVATCKHDVLRSFNVDLIKAIYPPEQ